MKVAATYLVTVMAPMQMEIVKAKAKDTAKEKETVKAKVAAMVQMKKRAIAKAHRIVSDQGKEFDRLKERAME